MRECLESDSPAQNVFHLIFRVKDVEIEGHFYLTASVAYL